MTFLSISDGFAAVASSLSAGLVGGILAVATDDVSIMGIPLSLFDKLGTVTVLALFGGAAWWVSKGLFSKLEDAHAKTLTAKDEIIKSKDETIAQLKKRLQEDDGK